jgi:hypothetical protein
MTHCCHLVLPPLGLVGSISVGQGRLAAPTESDPSWWPLLQHLRPLPDGQPDPRPMLILGAAALGENLNGRPW